MKPLLFFACLALAAVAGAVGGMLAAPAPKPAASEPISPAAVVAPTTVSAEAQKRMDQLALEVADLQAQIAALNASKERTPAVTVAEPVKPAEIESTTTFAALHRDAILKVIADQKAEEDRKREEERVQQQLQQQQQRADRVAQKLSLNEVQRRELTDFYVLERTKMDEMRNQARDSSDPTAMRDGFQKLNDWRTQQLGQLFGNDLAAQIQELDNGRGRRGGGGGGPGGGPGGPSGSGNGNGGGGGGANRQGGGTAPGR